MQTTCCIPTVAESQRDYRVSTTTVSSRGAGESSCGADGLARIDSAVEQARAAAACGSRMCWIGITDNAISGRWINSDGSLPLYTNWNEQYRQPGNNQGHEPYAIINAGDVSVYDGSWFDAPDGSFAYALCNVYPPPPSPPSPPPPSGSTVIIAVGAGAGGVVVLLLVLLAIVLSRKAKPVVPPPAQPNTMPQPQSQIEMGAVGASSSSGAMNAAVIGVAQPAAVASTSGSSSSNLAFAPRFDANTGQPIPKFDPETGKQNWA